MKVFALWMLWAPVSARTPESELPWQAASRISPLTRRADNYCLCASACVWVGGWSACPRRAAEHLLGSAPTNQASDVRWQWKIPPEQVWDPAQDWDTRTVMCWTHSGLLATSLKTWASHTVSTCIMVVHANTHVVLCLSTEMTLQSRCQQSLIIIHWAEKLSRPVSSLWYTCSHSLR